jgi:DNA primase
MVVEEIKSRLDLVTYIGQHVALKKAGRHHKALCPFHSEHTGSFMVSEERQSWKCYGCGAGGDLFTFAMKFHNWTFPECLEELGKLAGVEVKRDQQQNHDVLYGILNAAVDLYHRLLLDWPSAQHARDYVDSRGLLPETVERFGLGFAPNSWHSITNQLRKLDYKDDDLVKAGVALRNEKGVYDALRNRLIIPIRDARGRVIALAGRTLDGSEPKYLNTAESPLFQKGRVLFGYDRNAVRGHPAVIVEGYMDVMTAHEAGFTNVVAQMGTSLTEVQAKLLADARYIVLALDGDAAGQNATRRSVEQAVKSGRDVRIAHVPQGYDPDSLIRLSPPAWAVLIEKAVPVADYLIDHECASLPENATVQEREALARKLLPILVAAESDIYKHANVQKLALALRLPEAPLMALAAVPTAPPVVQVEPTNAPASREAYCVRALLHDDSWYSHIVRAFRALEIPDFGVDDFTTYRPVIEALDAARLQFDIDAPDYVRAHVDAALLDDLGDAPLLLQVFIEQAFRLRLTRLTDEIAQLLQMECPDQARVLLAEKAKIQYRTKK